MLHRRLVAEAVGTALLVFLAVGVATRGGTDRGDALRAPLALALTRMVAT